tara:strand:- start:153 stop:464 length:312 start_codon:yes stop_codon:yes gene_type:complete
MNKSLAVKNRLYLFFLLLISIFIFIYLFYFLIEGNRGIISFFKISKQNLQHKHELSILTQRNIFLQERINRLQSQDLDLDFLDEKIREKTGYIAEDEFVVIFN